MTDEKKKAAFRGYIVAVCGMCEYEFQIPWDTMLAAFPEGVEAGARLSGQCPQCKAKSRLSILEDVIGRRPKPPHYTELLNFY
jgi:hypothetical protein